jgi:hypothetical protein
VVFAFVNLGGQRSHDEGKETRAPKAAKTRFGIVEIERGAHHDGCCKMMKDEF